MVNWKAYRKDRNLLQNSQTRTALWEKKSQCFGIHCSEYLPVQNFALGMKSLPSGDGALFTGIEAAAASLLTLALYFRFVLAVQIARA